MKRYSVIFLIGLFYASAVSQTAAQQPTCEGNSYSTEIISKKIVSQTCVEYEVKVSYDGSRTFGLSHFSLAIPCGELKNVSNSKDWKQVFGKDPTTGVYGLKIDNINGFGENGAASFIIKFTWCSSVSSCDKKLGVVAYKAGQCIDYGSLQDASSSSGTNDHGGDDGKNHDGDKGKGDCGNPAHDHSRDEDGGKNCDGKDGSGGGTGSGGGGNGTGGTEQKPTCDGNSYSSEITSKKTVSESCVEYEVKVSYDGTRAFGLSHFTMAIPCGELKNISNSENWQQVFGKDPTTGVYGLKIDNINGFGENGADSFIIKFTWCSDASCDKTLGVVSYKAGQCIDYDTLQDNSGNNGGGTTDGGGDTGGGGNGDTTGDGGTDNGGDTPSDSTSTTCSTLLAKLQKINASCFGSSDGQLEVIIQDGVSPYTYAWSTGESTSSIQNLSEGNYVVTVTDAKSNTMTLSETITAPGAIAITESMINPSCNGFTNGSIDLTVSGGNGVYAFAWSNGSTQQNLTNVGAGSHTVLVSDGSGCSSQKTFTLVYTTAITVGVSFAHPGCGQSNGTIDITPTGGVSPYTYLWNTGATTQDLQNGGPGTYSVKIMDATGCSVNMVYALRINNTLSLKYVVTPTSCADDSSGAIDLSVSGGTAPYAYLWQDGITTEDRGGLKAALYKVTVTDAGGCTSSVSISVYKKTFQVTSEVTQPTCAGDLGSITVTPMDGVAPYTYSWSSGDTGHSLTDVSGGTYSVTITDASGCSVTMVFVMPTLMAISATNMVSNTQCGIEGAYAIDLSVSGGKSPYTYGWSNGATTQDIAGLNAGTYRVQITDANGCSTTQEVVVNTISVSWTCLINQPVNEIVCKSAGNMLSTSVMDASTYQWSVSSSDNSWVITAGSHGSAVVYSAGNAGISATFTLTITKDGCTKTCTFETSIDGCVEKDNTGGGDPLSGDPCVSDSTSTTQPTASQESEVLLDETPVDASDEITELHVSAYPNPFTDRINFEWTAPHDDYVHMEIFDALGRTTSVIFSGNVQKGRSYNFDWTPTGTDKIYFYKCNSSKKTDQGKLFRR